MDIVYLILGIAGLLIGTELTIGGALAIARKHHLSEFFVGLIVLSIGSDLPEIAVAIDAGMKSAHGLDASGVVVGATVGSVVAQIGFVLGVAGLLSYLTLPQRYIYRHGAVLLGSTVLLFLVAFDGLVSRIEGLILITFYIIYVVVLLAREKVPEEIATKFAGDAFRKTRSEILSRMLHFQRFGRFLESLILANRDVLHLRGDDALPRVMHLRDAFTLFCAQHFSGTMEA